MAKITAKTISKDIDIVKDRVQDITFFVDKTKYEYIKKSKLIKSNLSLLKQLKKRSRELEKELQRKDEIQKTDLQRIDERKKQEQQQKIEADQEKSFTKLLLESFLGVGVAGMVIGEQIQEQQETKPDGSNGRLKPDQLKDVGDGFRLWAPAADSYLQMKAAAAKDKVYFKLSSAYRTYEEQAKLEQELGTWSPTNPGAAPPGTSAHGWGIAIDISSPGAQQWIGRYGSRYGWYSTVSNEPWHFEWKGSASNIPQSKVTPTVKKNNVQNNNLLSYNPPEEQTVPPLFLAIAPAPENPGAPVLSSQEQSAPAPKPPLNNNTTNPFFITPTG
jgi:LAS superfamily LD-carboxypeptidase LdcB